MHGSADWMMDLMDTANQEEDGRYLLEFCTDATIQFIRLMAATGVPCAVMYGERDGTWNQETQNEMAVRLGTSPIRIPDATHLPMLENVDATAEALVQIFERATQATAADRA